MGRANKNARVHASTVLAALCPAIKRHRGNATQHAPARNKLISVRTADTTTPLCIVTPFFQFGFHRRIVILPRSAPV